MGNKQFKWKSALITTVWLFVIFLGLAMILGVVPVPFFKFCMMCSGA